MSNETLIGIILGGIVGTIITQWYWSVGLFG